MMRIAYANAFYRPDRPSGGNAHIAQFIANAVSLGHEVWTWPGDQHPAAQRLPDSSAGRLLAMRRMDVLYVRMEDTPPGPVRWAIPPYRQLAGSPLVAWEFNTAPEFGLLVGRPPADVERSIQCFRHYGQGCDLAVCVSSVLAGYAQQKLGIRRVLTVPNGSDPDLFRPDVPPMPRLQLGQGPLNVIWMGSADIAWHNLDLLRDTAHLLWNNIQQTQIAFHIIGQGHVRIGEMPPNVSYYGAERYEKLPHWLAGMDVGLVLYNPGPGDYGSPLKLFDYLASGLAVVGSFQPQLQEVFGQLDQLDLMVPYDDPQALATILLGLAADRERVRHLGMAGRQLIIEKYNWRVTTRTILTELEVMLQGRRPA